MDVKAMANEDTRVQLSMKQFAIIIGVMLTMMTTGTAALGYVFASKADVEAIKLKMADTGGQQLSSYRIQTLEVKATNLEIRIQKIDTNLAKLLERFRVATAPEPKYLPLPEPPKEE